MDTNHDTKKLFMYAILCLSLAVGLSSGVFSNYFKEVFAVDSVQRGLLEIPRETPGILCVVILTALSGLGNLSLMVMAYGFCTLGLAVLGLLSPSYFIMQIFLFFLFPGRAYDDAPAGQHCHGSVGRGENGDFFRTA